MNSVDSYYVYIFDFSFRSFGRGISPLRAIFPLEIKVIIIRRLLLCKTDKPFPFLQIP